MRVPKVDQSLCQGCGNCEAICPEVFEVREDGLSYVIATDLAGLEACVEAAVENCPEDAITFEEEE
ncbi:MAG: ferredoxin [Thermoleophilia bacterium]|nr:ferredoxin [Thermoleophilia bacterium]